MGLTAWETQFILRLLATPDTSIERGTSGIEQGIQRIAVAHAEWCGHPSKGGQLAGSHLRVRPTEAGTHNNYWLHLVTPSRAQAYRICMLDCCMLNRSGSSLMVINQVELQEK